MRLFLSATTVFALAAFSGCRKESAPAPSPKTEGTAAERPNTDSVPAGSTLAYKLPCGRDSSVSLFDDTAGDDADYVRHTRIDSVFSDSGYFIKRTFYEGGDWLFVAKRDCARTELFGPVIFNPARTRFASINADMEAAFEANGVEIISLAGGKAQAEMHDEMKDWGPRQGAWKDDSTFVAALEDLSGHRKQRTYALRGGHWTQADAGAAATAKVDTLPYPEERPDSD